MLMVAGNRENARRYTESQKPAVSAFHIDPYEYNFANNPDPTLATPYIDSGEVAYTPDSPVTLNKAARESSSLHYGPWGIPYVEMNATNEGHDAKRLVYRLTPFAQKNM